MGPYNTRNLCLLSARLLLLLVLTYIFVVRPDSSASKLNTHLARIYFSAGCYSAESIVLATTTPRHSHVTGFFSDSLYSGRTAYVQSSGRSGPSLVIEKLRRNVQRELLAHGCYNIFTHCHHRGEMTPCPPIASLLQHPSPVARHR